MKQQNFVYILADDLGWRDLSVEGSPLYESPNIDRIANEGIRFTQGYAACQVCSPSRASILTGKFTPRHGVTNYIGAPSGEDWREIGRYNKLLPPDYERGLRHSEVTFAEVLRRNNYRTFFAGKWHLGDGSQIPENFGFEINKGGFSAGIPIGGYFSPYHNPKLEDGPDGESLPTRLGKETAKFIEENKNYPFLAYLSFYSVHSPIQTSKHLWEKYRIKARKNGDIARDRFIFDRNLPVRQIQDCPIYAGMIEAMDAAVGDVLNTLDRLGLAENTVVCFTSDNGGVSSGDAFSTSNLPLRGGKGRQWEGGIREPFFIKAPGITRPGSTCHVPVSGIDFYPTLLELAGLPLPETQAVDGMSLVDLMGGKNDDLISNRDLFWHYPHYGNQGGEPSSIIRSGYWKLIHYFEDGRDELYDLQNDPGESKNVKNNNPKLARNMRSRLDEWLLETGAKTPDYDPEYDTDKEQARLEIISTKYMEQLEEEHAAYLDEKWSPDDGHMFCKFCGTQLFSQSKVMEKSLSPRKECASKLEDELDTRNDPENRCVQCQRVANNRNWWGSQVAID